MKTDIVTTVAFLLSLALCEMHQISLQAIGKDFLSVGTVSPLVHPVAQTSYVLC
jgi:hypothetical protein